MRRQITWHICVDVSEVLAPIVRQMMGAADSSKKSVKSTILHGVTFRNSAATHRAAFPTLTRLLQSRPCNANSTNTANHKQMDKTVSSSVLPTGAFPIIS
jgi:hypothetical protein